MLTLLPTYFFVVGWKMRKANEQRPDLLLLVLLFSTPNSYAPPCKSAPNDYNREEGDLQVEQHFAPAAKYQDCPTNASLPVPPPLPLPLPPAPTGEQQLSPNSRTFFRRLPSLQGFHPHVGQEAWTSCCPRTTKLYIVG